MAILKNAKHELFAQAIASGKSADDAYTLAGFKPSRKNGHRLKATEAVRGRIVELQAAMAARMQKNVVLTREWVERELVDNVGKAKLAGDYSAANQALRLLGIEKQMFIERRESGRPGEFSEAEDAASVLEQVGKLLGPKAAAALQAAIEEPAATEAEQVEEQLESAPGEPPSTPPSPTNDGSPAVN